MLKVAAVLLSYLVGSISTAYIIGKKWYNIDIRKYGSGNAGATNALRVLGKKAAVCVLIADLLKGVIAGLIGRLLGGESLAAWCGLAAISGHNWPVFFGFRGGKGIATSIGALLAASPYLLLWTAIPGLLVLAVTRFVSLASITGAVVLPFISIILHKPWNFTLFTIIVSSMAVYRHRSNIVRLLKGQESRFGGKKNLRVK